MKVEFRDGERELPDYLAEQMSGMDTYKMTVEEAIREVNERQLRMVLQTAYDKIVDEHMRNLELGL